MTVLDWAVQIGFTCVGLSLGLVLIRLIRGPSLPDRVVALDMIAFLAVGTIALWTLSTRVAAYLDAALLLALIAFLATVAFGRYIEEMPPPSNGTPQS